MKIFVINSGSSSIKYQLFNMPDPKPVCLGQIEKIGGQAEISHTVSQYAGTKLKKTTNAKDHKAAMEEILKLLTDRQSGVISSANEIEVVGHRIVHGGEEFADATEIDEPIKNKIRSLFTLAPLHNPVNFECLELAEESFPAATQIAVFDTAFHQTIPAHAYRYAIPEKFYNDDRIRVYGFHGTSHKYIVKKAAEFLGQMPGKIVSVHLGNGCSITAVKDGRSVDTSMGFGPLDGLVMGTRSGDIDPSVIFHLADKLKMDMHVISDLLNKQSGMKGLAGSNDMRDIRKKFDAGDKKAALAVTIYVYRIKKYIGSYAAAMNGLDAVLFTAGVGENDQLIRRLVCEEMNFLGMIPDHDKNLDQDKHTREIHSANSRVKILVVPTNEEIEIAEQCYKIVLEKSNN